MLFLLPPSESKAAPARGPALELQRLGFPALCPVRQRVLAELVTMCGRDAAAAQAALGLSDRQRGEVTRNAELLTAPTAPAWQVYTGVLYDALDPHSLSSVERQRLKARVAIASALWGLVRAADRIPAYRLSASGVLPGVDPLTRLWRGVMAQTLCETRGLVVDMRSSSYVALGPVPAEMAHRTVTVCVSEVRGGKRVSVSHNNKATKGLLVRTALSWARPCRSVDELATAWTESGFDVRRKGAVLDVTSAA